MNEIIEKLFDLANKVDEDLYEEVIDIANELSDVKENLTQALEKLDPVDGLDNLLDDVDLIIQILE